MQVCRTGVCVSPPQCKCVVEELVCLPCHASLSWRSVWVSPAMQVCRRGTCVSPLPCKFVMEELVCFPCYASVSWGHSLVQHQSPEAVPEWQCPLLIHQPTRRDQELQENRVASEKCDVATKVLLKREEEKALVKDCGYYCVIYNALIWIHIKLQTQTKLHLN